MRETRGKCVSHVVRVPRLCVNFSLSLSLHPNYRLLAVYNFNKLHQCICSQFVKKPGSLTMKTSKRELTSPRAHSCRLNSLSVRSSFFFGSYLNYQLSRVLESSVVKHVNEIGSFVGSTLSSKQSNFCRVSPRNSMSPSNE